MDPEEKMKTPYRIGKKIYHSCQALFSKNHGNMKTIASIHSLHASMDFIPVVDQHPDSDENQNKKHLHGQDELNNNFDQGKWGVRHTMIIIGTMGTVLMVTMRNNLSMAIVDMVDRSGRLNSTNTTLNLNDTCPVPYQADDGLQHEQRGEFQWDEKTQGFLLGAYFYGNIFTNLVGGRMSEYLGGRLMFGLGIFLSALSTLLSPIAARTSINFFFAVRLFTGFAQGLVQPAMTRCLVTWIPPRERSKFNTVVFAGAEIGTVTSMAVGGWLCQLNFLGGWPLVFYIFGILGVLWTFLWFFLISERPETHPRISPLEKEYIMLHCKVKRGKPISVPWHAVLTSVPLWAVFVMHFGHNWGYYTFLTLLPSYLSNIQHFQLQSNGLLCALPYATKWVFANVWGFIVNSLIISGKLSTLSVRRISMILGSFAPALGLVILTMTGCDQKSAVMILVISTTFSGAVFCGYFCSHQDLCPNLAGTLFGFSNFLANTTGFIAPATAGAILYNNQTVGAWNTVFYISAVVYASAATIFAIFISADIQPFNNPKCKESTSKDEKDNLNSLRK